MTIDTLIGPVGVVAAIALFLVAGAVHPRRTPAVDRSELQLNLLTGGGMFLLRVGLLALIAGPVDALGGGLLDLSAVRWPALQALLVFLVLDLGRYWLHRLDHRVPWLWTFHRVHHSTEHLDATAGLRMHAVDIAQLTLLPVVLLSLLLDVSSFHPAVLPGVLLVGAVFDAFEHSNLAMDMTRPHNSAWNMVFNNPHFHSWHHTRDGSRCDGNYGQALTIWDRLFGSDVTGPEPPEALGLEGDQALEHGVLAMQLLRTRQQADATERGPA
ncbi:MAG TPA: sterol desaturase family protein [Myxococcota bacterium]|nr:sterol desaturase family protein [Myxococcota bacterium]